MVFFNYCYFKTITIASLSIAAVLLYTAPAMVMLMSAVLFHEKITRRRLGSLVATFVGCMLVTGVLGEQEGLTVGSICVGLGAGLGYALYSIFGRYALERGYEPITISFYTFLLAAVGTLPFSNGWAVVKAVTSEASVLGLSLLFGLFTTVIPYIVYTAGLKELETSRAAILASIEPVTATLFGVFLYQEGLSFSELLGIILVLSGIVISNIEKKSKA